MPKFRVEAIVHIRGHMTVEAEDEGAATNAITDDNYALSDLTIDDVTWEVDFMEAEK